MNEALAHFRSSVETLETIRASLSSQDVWKVSFRKGWNDAYSCLLQVLIMLQKTDKALYAAEQGRAQALLDALQIKYGFASFPHRSYKSEEEVTNPSRKISTLTAFLAIKNETINICMGIGKGKQRCIQASKVNK